MSETTSQAVSIARAVAAVVAAVGVDIARAVLDRLPATTPRRPDLELVDAIDAALADPALTLERARELLAAASSELETLDVLAEPDALARLQRARGEAERGEVVGMDVIRADLERQRSWSPGQMGVGARQGQSGPEPRAEAR